MPHDDFREAAEARDRQLDAIQPGGDDLGSTGTQALLNEREAARRRDAARRRRLANRPETFWIICADCGDTTQVDDVTRSEVEARVSGCGCRECGATDPLITDEPPGSGADPYGRPDPRTHPEFWTE